MRSSLLEFSIELFARIVHCGAGNGPYCRRIEAAAQEKLGPAGALGGVSRRSCAEAAAQLRCGDERPVRLGGVDQRRGSRASDKPVRFQLRADAQRPIALRDAAFARALTPKRSSLW